MKQNKSKSIYQQANKKKREANIYALLKVHSVRSGQWGVSPTIYQLFP